MVYCSILNFVHKFWPKLQILCKFEQNWSCSFCVSLVPYNNINNKDWNFSNHSVGLSDLKADISAVNSISILFYDQYTLSIHSTGEKVKILVLQISIFSESERTNVSFKRSSESLHWSAEAWLGQNTLHNWKLNICELVAFC